MSQKKTSLVTPIYLKTHAEITWPADGVFYLMTSDGLFLCRNHGFFRSCVPARSSPSELAAQEPFVQLQYPKIPQGLLELAVGFFDRIGRQHAAEAAVLILWHGRTQRVQLFPPNQVCTVRKDWRGEPYPIGVHYQVPVTLPSEFVVIGDIHSHVEGAAYASYTDKADEKYRTGVHVVVGRLNHEPPDFHVEMSVDGTRFEVETKQVIEGYARRRTNVPQCWFDKVTISSESYWHRETTCLPARTAAASRDDGRCAKGDYARGYNSGK